MKTDPINDVRSSIYQLLSSLFAKEINTEALQLLTNTRGKHFWHQLALDDVFKADVDIIVSQLNALNDEAALLELAADYCSLFLMGGKYSASPYAGLYLNVEADRGHEELQIFGEQHQNMMNVLQQSSLQVESKFPEPADHIAVILAYLAKQCAPTSYSDQLTFITENLTNWFSQFVTVVEKNDQGSFYSALARLTQTWIETEQQWLTDEVSAQILEKRAKEVSK